MRARIQVEIEYLLALSDLEATPLNIDGDARRDLQSLYADFSEEDAEVVKKIEIEGYEDYEATNHDVKAVEYFIRYRLPEDYESMKPWIHFGLTSEDINNIAHRLLVRDAMEAVLLPELRTIRDELASLARKHSDVPMPGRTHGQPATPTTFGKEMAVYTARLGQALGRVQQELDDLTGKLNGATGTYAAHVAAYPDVNWREFAREFVASFDLTFAPATTQINPCDDLAALLDALRGVNNILLDVDIDMWLYVGDQYLVQRTVDGEVGSSTMPHKVNPIDFEIGEGNLSKANADLTFLADYITSSRLQRDLSDSTAKRNLGVAMGHSLIGYERTREGLETIRPNKQLMREELAAVPEVIGEAIQTILRREGHKAAYEQVKALTRGRRVTLEDFHELFDNLDLDEAVQSELSALTPDGYIGLAEQLAADVEPNRYS